MNSEMKIIDALMKIQERSNVFRHGQEEVFHGINLAEVHCIDWVGTMERANVTKIANEMSMTRGAISKINKKLLSKGLIESYQLPENNKEVYYRLTSSGQQVYGEHKKCHSKSKEEKLLLLENYDDNEQAIILHFLSEVNHLLEKNLR